MSDLDDIESMEPAEPMPPMGPMCGRCYEEGVPLHPAKCAEKPELLLGMPLGMYHCPDCGAMVLAGLPHPDLCELCNDRRHPGYDRADDAR